MRFLAFTLFATAAFDWPLPWLDRAGTAALGLAFLTLAVVPDGLLRARPARMNLPPKRAPLPDSSLTEAADDMLEQILAHSNPRDDD